MNFQFEMRWEGGGVRGLEKINKRRLAGIWKLKLKLIFKQIDAI